jgi:hypothetical protein
VTSFLKDWFKFYSSVVRREKGTKTQLCLRNKSVNGKKDGGWTNVTLFKKAQPTQLTDYPQKENIKKRLDITEVEGGWMPKVGGRARWTRSHLAHSLPITYLAFVQFNIVFLVKNSSIPRAISADQHLLKRCVRTLLVWDSIPILNWIHDSFMSSLYLYQSYEKTTQRMEGNTRIYRDSRKACYSRWWWWC